MHVDCPGGLTVDPSPKFPTNWRVSHDWKERGSSPHCFIGIGRPCFSVFSSPSSSLPFAVLLCRDTTSSTSLSLSSSGSAAAVTSSHEVSSFSQPFPFSLLSLSFPALLVYPSVCFPRVSTYSFLQSISHVSSPSPSPSPYRLASSLLVDINSESFTSVGIPHLPFLASPISFSFVVCGSFL